MMQYAIKVLITALVVVAVSETAKRSSLIAALIASLPFTSLLAFMWLYADTHDTARIASLSLDILWLVVPSLVLFAVLPLLLRLGWGFWVSLGAACACTALAYAFTIFVVRRLVQGA
jgi:hypothetical protein